MLVLDALHSRDCIEFYVSNDDVTFFQLRLQQISKENRIEEKVNRKTEFQMKRIDSNRIRRRPTY